MPSHSELLRLLAVAAVGLAPCSAAPAQTQPGPPPAAAAARGATADTAALVLHGRTVAVFRAPIGPVSPAERAAAAARRMEAAEEADAGDSVTFRAIPEGVLVSVGNRSVFTITPAEVDTLGGDSLRETTARAVQQLRLAVRATREERSISHLIKAAAFSLVATILFLSALRLLRGSRRLLLNRLPEVGGRRFRIPSIGGFTLIGPEHLLIFVRRLVDLLAWGTGLFAAYVWLAFILTRFAYTRPWGEALGSYLTTTVGRLALSAVSGVPGIFTVVLILVATRWTSRVVTSFFDAVGVGRVEVPWVHAETANPTRRIAVALLWLFAIVVAYPYLPGSGSDVFKGVSVFAGLVLSIGSSGIVNQGMSGLVLMYARAFKPGEYVRIGETEGVVTELGMLSTKIRTTKNEEVTLPNATVVTASVKNYSRGDNDSRLMLYTNVTIGYDTPWRTVEALLLSAAGRTGGLSAHPAALVLKTALSDFYVEYQLNAAMDHPEQRLRVLDRLHANVLDAFNEAGVQIMSPHYRADPREPKLAPPDKTSH